MSILGRSVIAVSLLLVVGCEDGQAKRRAEVAQSIAEATADMRRAEAQLQVPDQRDTGEQTLRRVIAALGNTNDGVDGQRAAAMKLAANAHRQLASVAMSKAKTLESRNRARRAVAGCTLDAADRLDALASALESLDTASVETRLDDDRQAAANALTVFSQQVADLDGPIAEIESENRADREAVQKLRTQAAELRRAANDLGPVEGLDSFAEGLDLGRQADEIELRVAEREIELRYQLESEHALAQTSVAHLRDRITTLSGAQDALAGHAETMAEQAQAARGTLAESRDALGAELAAVAERQAQLDEIYATAIEQLERAATRATSAAGLLRGDANAVDAARVEAAQAHQALGSLHHQRARGLAGQAALLRRIDSMSDVIGLEVDAAAAEAAAEDAAAKAKAAWGEAGSVLGQVSGRIGRERLDALKQQIAALESGEIIQPPAAAPAPMAGGPAPRPATAGSSGADSPQAIVDMINAQDPMTAVRLFDCLLLDGAPPEVRQFFTAIADSMKAVQRLDAAAQAKFGHSVMDEFKKTPGMGGEFGSATLGAVSGDTATITVVNQGKSEDAQLQRINGRWFMVPPADMMPGGGGMASNPQAEAQMKQMMQAMMAMFQQATTATNNFAKQIEAGQYASFEELQAALDAYEQQMMQRMGGLFGGGGR